MTGDKRPKRRCVKKQEGPSGAHYVGYVEDEETPEAIMAKFAFMEQVLCCLHGYQSSCIFH